MLERQPCLNTRKLIMDIFQAIHDGQSKLGRNTISIENTLHSMYSALFVSMLLVEHAKEELPLSPICNLTATDEEED